MLIHWFPRSALCCIKQFFVGILKWRHPKLDGLYMVETLIIWMIWGYHNFRKPPFVHYIYSELMLSQSINYLCYMMLQLDCCSHARLWAQDPLINHKLNVQAQRQPQTFKLVSSNLNHLLKLCSCHSHHVPSCHTEEMHSRNAFLKKLSLRHCCMRARHDLSWNLCLSRNWKDRARSKNI